MHKFVIVRHGRKVCQIKMRVPVGLGAYWPMDFDARCDALVASLREVWPRTYYEDSPTQKTLDVVLECAHDGFWRHVETFSTHRSETLVCENKIQGLVYGELGIIPPLKHQVIPTSAVISF